MSPQETTPQAPPAPTNHLILDGNKLPCYVKAAVYHAGQAGGLGIKTMDPAVMMVLLQDEARQQQIREMLRKQVDEELTYHRITYGIDEEAIQALSDSFVESVVTGTESMVTGKIADGTLPEAGQDGFLQYYLNPDGLPLKAMGRAARLRAAKMVHQVKEGDLIVERHPPEGGKNGTNVR